MEILIKNPVLLLFLIAGLGFALGQIKFFGFNLGIAAILFTGLAAGAVFPELKLPEAFYRLGLVLFVYTVGLSSGPGFFASFKRKGFRDNFFVMLLICLSGILSVLFAFIFKIKSTYISGMFAGSLTNTPALAGVLEYMNDNGIKGKALSEPVVAYAITYPAGVIGMVLAIYFFQRFWNINYSKESGGVYTSGSLSEKISTLTIQVDNAEITGKNANSLLIEKNWRVIFGRIKTSGKLSLVNEETTLQKGDLLTITGIESEILKVAGEIGIISEEKLELDRHQYDFRRIIVSNRELIGKSVSELNLSKFGAVITRIRRGDVDLVASPESVLEPGDRVRVVTNLKNMVELSKYFGDSFKKISEIDVISFSLGIALGLLLGSVPLQLTENLTFKLGFAGGPLVIGLILGKLQRTGPFLWQIPFTTNLTLRQFGLVLFLSGIGIASGTQIITIFSNKTGLYLFFIGLFITLFTAILTLWVGYRFLKIPMGILTGILSGLQTQPAILAFAGEQSDNDLPNIGYATVFPFAMILKILIAQLLLLYLP